MKPLQDLLYGVHITEVHGPAGPQVTNVHFDSRQVQDGNLFVAVRGTSTDGHTFIAAAEDRGARVVICETLPDKRRDDVTYVRVQSSAEALGQIASNWYNRPSDRLKIVGVTGTNGKTTVSTVLYNLFRSLGYRCGLVSTVAIKIEDEEQPAKLTTPDALALQHAFADMVEAGCQYCFMEVSSIAVDQRRIAGTHFVGAIFTNLTHDHLDYHKTFANYLKAKQQFFDGLSPRAFALTNADDRNGHIMVQNTRARVKTYALHGVADYAAKLLENRIEGLHLQVNGQQVWFQLPGEFNAYNLMAVYGAAVELGEDSQQVLIALSELRGARGRFEAVPLPNDVSGIVDYAHTPDALLNVLQTARDLMHKGRIICLVGCGGDRDRTKRPEMARIATECADVVVLTSDNPRTELPGAILDEMEAGVPTHLRKKVMRIEDRREAIRAAARLAEPGDLLLVAGKGHETYQEINGVRHDFDDREELIQAFKLLY